jgi:hypothetical protein
MFKYEQAGPRACGVTPRKRKLRVFTGGVISRHHHHDEQGHVPCVGDWLEFAEYRTRQIQKLAQIVAHYLDRRRGLACTWTKVVGDITGHYGDHIATRRVYDVVNVLKALFVSRLFVKL